MINGYKSPDGNWYESPEQEIKHKEECLRSTQEMVQPYSIVWKVIGKPSTLYLALRAFGQLGGVVGLTELNHEPVDFIDYIDSVAFGAFYISGISKLAEGLIYIDILSSKKNLKKTKERLSLEGRILD